MTYLLFDTQVRLHVEGVSNSFEHHHSNSDKTTFSFNNKCMINVLVLVID